MTIPPVLTTNVKSVSLPGLVSWTEGKNDNFPRPHDQRQIGVTPRTSQLNKK